VTQAPVVTDYSNSLLIPRSLVEKYNARIQAIGFKNIQSLVEMKNYRKGIHLLEWYCGP
jgi:hypothetical protein